MMMIYHTSPEGVMKAMKATQFTRDLPGAMPRFPADYTLVALVEANDVESAFHFTNHTDRDWTTNPGVTMKVTGGARSTSVGDVVVRVDEARGAVDAFRCDSVGWTLLRPNA